MKRKNVSADEIRRVLRLEADYLKRLQKIYPDRAGEYEFQKGELVTISYLLLGTYFEDEI